MYLCIREPKEMKPTDADGDRSGKGISVYSTLTFLNNHANLL